MKSRRILVLGAGGMFGATLVPVLAAAGHHVIRHSRTPRQAQGDLHADLADRDATRALFEAVDPNIVVNLVAATNVDLCETDPHQAYVGNVVTAGNVAHAARAMPGAHVIHVSTDQVYDGPGPHAEANVVIRNTYAQTKRAGELLLEDCAATILRTNFVGPSHVANRTSLSDWIAASLAAGSTIPVFTDVFFSPLTMSSLSNIIVELLSEPPVGVFNVGSREGLSKAAFAFAFAEAMDLPQHLLVPTLSDAVASNRARRPKDMRMSVAAIETVLGKQMPTLADEITSLSRSLR